MFVIFLVVLLIIINCIGKVIKLSVKSIRDILILYFNLGPRVALPGRATKPSRKAAAPRRALQGLAAGAIPPPAVPGPTVESTPPLPLEGHAIDVPLPVSSEHQQAEVNPRGEPYDPEDPTTDEIEGPGFTLAEL